ncbi:MAG: hypothetical protein V2J26_00950 [Pacificimonas sp.]|jgi:hypothetical protein|nr:hypothetical protein [Pacificimonas sp.]
MAARVRLPKPLRGQPFQPLTVGKALVLGAATAGLAVAAFLNAAGNVLAHRNAELAVRLSPDDAEALAIHAQQLVLGAAEDEAVAGTASALAIRALRKDAAEYRSYRTLAAARSLRGDFESAAPFYEQGLAITKRDVGARLDRVRLATARGDRDAFVRETELALRVSPGARRQLLPLLAGGLVDQPSIEIAIELLSGNPAWRIEFWQAILAAPAGIAALPALLREAADRGVSVPERLVLPVINRKVADGDAAQAVAIGRALIAAPRDDPAAPIAPFEWAYYPSGSWTVFAGNERGAFALDAQPGTGGIAARRLVEFPPAARSVEIRFDAARGGGSADRLPFVTLTCASPLRSIARVSAMEAGTGGPVRVSQTVPFDFACDYAWADFRVPTLSPGETLALDITNLAVVLESGAE